MRLCKIACLVVTAMLSLTVSALEKQFSQARQACVMADSLYAAEKFPQALELYVKALELAERDGDTDIYLTCTGHISIIYDAFGDYESALNYMLKGYAEAIKGDNDRLKYNYLSNIVIGYTRVGDVANAKKYFALQKAVPLSYNPDYQRYYILYNEALILGAEGRYQDAIAAHQKALDYAAGHDLSGTGQKSGIYTLYQESEIGNLYVKMADAGKALQYGYLCLRHARQLGSDELLANAYKMLGDAYRLREDVDSINKYMRMYAEVSDSVYDVKSYYTAKNQLAEYEERFTRERISNLWRTIAFVTVLVVVLLVMLFMVWRYNRSLRQAQRLLISKNDELEQQAAMSRQLLQRYLHANGPDTGVDDATQVQTDAAPAKEGKRSIDSTNGQAALLERIMSVLEDDSIIANPDFSMTTLAELAGSNTKYVSTVINETYKKNFKTLLNECRCRRASRLLLDKEQFGNLTMQAVYESVGYTNATSFIRAFKTVYGMTPSTYQRLSAESDAS